MNQDLLRQILQSVGSGDMTVETALQRLRDLPFADLGHTKLDLHRELRRGQPEAIFCAGKTPEQVVAIVRRMMSPGKTSS